MSSHKDEDFYAAAAPDINENDDRVDREDYENKVDDGGDDNDDDHDDNDDGQDDNDDGQDDNDDEDAGGGNDTVRLKIKKMISIDRTNSFGYEISAHKLDIMFPMCISIYSHLDASPPLSEPPLQSD